jgi:hypothetical protein
MQAIPDSAAAQQGLDYLRGHQRPNGGFVTGGNGGVNSQSTAWAVQGMIAVGADPDTVQEEGNSGLDYISGLQAADGHFRYSSSSDQTSVFVTGQVLVAAAGDAVPVPAPPRKQQPAPAKSAPAPTANAAPAPSPGVASPPSAGSAAPPSTAGSGAGGGGSGASGGGPAGHAGPLVPETSAAPPGAVPLPSEGETGSGLTEGAPTASIEEGGGGPSSPWIPIGIGVGVGVLALAVPLLLGKRFSW